MTRSESGDAPAGAVLPRAVVVCLCAAWCDTCNAFRAAFDAIARARPHIDFVWLDIEDDAELCGDVDVENFPTLLAYRGDAVLHYGVSLPHAGTVARLVDAVAQRSRPATGVPEAVLALPAALARRGQSKR